MLACTYNVMFQCTLHCKIMVNLYFQVNAYEHLEQYLPCPSHHLTHGYGSQRPLDAPMDSQTHLPNYQLSYCVKTQNIMPDIHD